MENNNNDKVQERNIMLWNVMMTALDKYLTDKKETVSIIDLFTIINMGAATEISINVDKEDKKIESMLNDEKFIKLVDNLGSQILIEVHDYLNKNNNVMSTDIIAAMAYFNAAVTDRLLEALDKSTK